MIKILRWPVVIAAALVFMQPMAALAATATTSVADPVRITIPAIHLDAPVQGRGTTAKGYMVPPTSPWKVAWYLHGVRPCERGNAVMYGHLNTFASARGVFTNLYRVRVGNLITVTDRKKVRRTFLVTAVKRYPTAQLPLKEISGKSTGRHLNLYTCAGWWNSRRQDYSHRLVVYTDLVRTTKPR